MAEIALGPTVVRCTGCKHVWAPIFATVPTAVAARILRKAKCPSCGANSASQALVLRDKRTGEFLV